MARKKGQGGSPSSPQPRFVLEDGQKVEVVADAEAMPTLGQGPRKRSRPATERVEQKYVTVNLQLRHSLNGKFYGPGPTKLTPAKAEMFMNNEHEAMEKELSLVQQQAFIIGFGPGGPVKRQVPYAKFDEILMREG